MPRTQLLLLSIIFIVSACARTELREEALRTSASFYDPGPAKTSEWYELLARAPTTNEEEPGQLDWRFGPALYRGRLEKNAVKVLIVGEDKSAPNLVHRAFSGPWGRELQDFLQFFGLRYSYLFLSPGRDTEFQQKLLTTALQNNSESLAVVIGFGASGKQSIARWISAEGGQCSPLQNLASCTAKATKLATKKNLLILGVPTPKENLADYRAGLQIAAQKISEAVGSDPRWLEEDFESPVLPGQPLPSLAKRQKDYTGIHASSLPSWDFAFGTATPLLDKQFLQRRSQLGAADVFPYREEKQTLQFIPLNEDRSYDEAHPIPAMHSPPDKAFLWPQENFEFDPGPCASYPCAVASLLSELGKAESALTEYHYAAQGFYRGRLNQAKIVVLADQAGEDDFFTARALTGEAGQKLQSFLRGMGILRSYAILRSSPIDFLELNDSERHKIALNEKVQKLRKRIIQKVIADSDTKLVLTMGDESLALWQAMHIKLPSIHLPLPTDSSHIETWNLALQKISAAHYPTDTKPSFQYKGWNESIPRADLALHTPWWWGSTGDHATRGKDNEGASIYRMQAPGWVGAAR